MMTQPPFAPSYPAPALAAGLTATVAQPQPAPPSPTFAQRPAAPRPIVRAQAPDDPAPPWPAPAEVRPTPVSLPAPEALGIAAPGSPAVESLDWAEAHRRLDRLGATCFHLDKLPRGGCRITCLLPTDQPGRAHHIESQADSEAEALRLALARAEEWSAGRR